LKIKKKQKRRRRTKILIVRGNEMELFNVKMGVSCDGAQEGMDIVMEKEQ
jgi:hypothetical protein